MPQKITLATRKSPLAIKQTEMAVDYLSPKIPDASFEILPLSTTGDKQKEWSLEEKGGKGLFTKELELALLEGRADLAVHSAKDLPTELPEGLAIAGFLNRGEPGDVFAIREDITEPKVIATGSPRRRSQIKQRFPNATYIEIRGNFKTRMDKIVNGYADATIMAAAGLKRLGIDSFPGLKFHFLTPEEMVPAVGQGAIALETTTENTKRFKDLLDQETAYAVTVERTFLAALGGGCHAAYAGYYKDGTLHTFHQEVGYKAFPFKDIALDEVDQTIKRIIEELTA